MRTKNNEEEVYIPPKIINRFKRRHCCIIRSDLRLIISSAQRKSREAENAEKIFPLHSQPLCPSSALMKEGGLVPVKNYATMPQKDPKIDRT
jgi:hypothetical protein